MAEKINFATLSIQELNHKLADFKEELRNLRFNKVIGQMANTSRLKIVKRHVARINTLLKEYKLNIRKPNEKKDA
jgi:large subunit ribosomal protein L29